MNYLSIQHSSKSYGEKLLFDDISLNIAKGDKVALVAKNGSGKSTLLRLISGEESGEGEQSKIELRRGISIGFLKQDPIFPDDINVLDAVFHQNTPIVTAIRNYEKALIYSSDDQEELQSAISEMDTLNAWDFESKWKEILFRFKLNDLDKKVDLLSGGEKKRLSLCQLLIEEPDFLILDEPTNHLDIEMIEWLESFLSQPSITLFMVTHDRYFLDRICTGIVELHRGKVYKYSGNYADFLIKKSARQENDLINLDKQKKLFRKELEWVSRQPKARGTKAKSRITKFEEIKEASQAKVQDEVLSIHFKANRLGKKILEFHYASKAFGEKVMLKDFNYKFKKGDRIGVVGKNGMGKSTLLNIITQSIKLDSGKLIVGETVQFGYFHQDGVKLDNDKRVIDVMRDIAEYIPLEKGLKMSAASLLERFLFPRPQQQVYVSQLSGGEKRRLQLLCVLMRNPNFLILDEPTNDLDILTLNVLENYLLDFQGCIMIVSHDRYFLDKLVDHLFILEGEGKIKDFNGNYSRYRAEKERSKNLTEVKENIIEASKSSLANKQRQENQKVLKRIEKQIAKLEAKKDSIMDRFKENPPTDQLIALTKELNELKLEIEQKENQWMNLAELIE